MTTTILILAANPIALGDPLELDREVRSIEQIHALSENRKRFVIKPAVAAQWDDLHQALTDLKPKIVHFVGHGEGEDGLMMAREGGGVEAVTGDRLAALFKLFPCVECVVLNACKTEVQAIVIHEHVRCVVGMSQKMGDEAARGFAGAFYRSIFAGDGYERAFAVGKTGIVGRLDGMQPMLLFREVAWEPVELEPPGSRMSVESKFYVSRSPAEEDAMREVVKPGALIRIKAPHEFGKSSLMGRVVAQAEAGGAKTVSINFREIDREFLGTLNGFLKHFCMQVTRKLKVPNRLGDYWDGGLGSKGDCGEYFEDYLLPLMPGALVLELDEMDVLFEGAGDKAWAIDFLSMLRAWFEKGRTSEKWKKLRLVLVHAKDIDQETLQQSQSPFNVGTEIELGEFDVVQVGDLAVRHGLGQSIAPGLMALVGGHPQLVRLGLYAIARGESLETLVATGATEAGLYGNHLRRVRSKLEGHLELKMAFQRVLAGEKIDQASSSALRSLGVGKLRGNKVEVTCELYRQYFRSVW